VHGGSIAVDRRMLWAALAAVPFLMFVGVMAMRQGATIIGGAVFVLAVVGFFGIAPAFSPKLIVEWDDDGIAGPSQVWGLFFGLGRARIGWDEIAALGGTAVGYAYVAAAAGRRIYWTEQYVGFDRLFRTLQRRRPDLGPGLGIAPPA
jgi:hypothetical protein